MRKMMHLMHYVVKLKILTLLFIGYSPGWKVRIADRVINIVNPLALATGVLWNCQVEVVNLTEIIFMIKTNLDGMGCVLNEVDNALKVQGLFLTWSTIFSKFSYQQVYSACICHPSICTQRLAFQQFLVKVFIESIQLVNLDIDKPMLRPSLSSYWGPV